VKDPRAERLRQFRLHGLVFTGVLFLAIAANALVSPGYPWWMWLGSVWALPLSLHWAYAHEIIGPKISRGDR
jgi:hypothetical protein